ncbi:MAG TPA: hypothetical protein DCS66_21545, partial [Flavobacteriaceae bacterium]|nr:hypothetical protein [Flavobacteriaceae bacterium]
MALYGLETLRITMENAWQYGDVECITEIKAINFDHDRIYPLCLIIEPNSIMPSIYEGWENYEYEVYFCMLWKKDNRDVSSRDLKWDNIQRIGNEWLDNVLNKYDNEDLILDDESLELERIKSFGNDKVLAIKFSFTLQAFRTCFNPKQFYVDSYYSNDRVEICVQQGDGGGGCDETISVPQCCRSWVRSDGWKEISFDNTLYNIMQFNDMSSYSGFIQPGIPPFDTLAHDFRVWNGVGKQNT